LLGTCSLHDNNELTIVDYNEDSNHIEVAAIYSHPDQIWAIEASPKQSELCVTSRQSPSGYKSITLWKMDKQSEDELSEEFLYPNDHLELEEVTSFNQSAKIAFVDTIKWHRNENKLLTFDGRILTTWQIGSNEVKVGSNHWKQTVCMYSCMLVLYI
jgi:hypothetical protein